MAPQRSRHVGELPKPCQEAGRAPLLQGKPATAVQNEYGPILLTPLPLGQAAGQLPPLPCGSGLAQVCQGTPAALGRAVGDAHRGPQLHERLGKVAAAAFRIDCRQRLSGFPPDGGQVYRTAVCQYPRQHPEHIPVHGRSGHVKGNGADGPGGVIANPRQTADGVIVPGNLSVPLLLDHLGCCTEVAHTGVVAQALPQLPQSIVRGFCQVCHSR